MCKSPGSQQLFVSWNLDIQNIRTTHPTRLLVHGPQAEVLWGPLRGLEVLEREGMTDRGSRPDWRIEGLYAPGVVFL